MLKFSTKRGWNYYYSSKDNRIRPLSCEYKEQHEGKHAYVSSDEYILNRISMFTIEVTQQCNLRCKYCCYSGAYDDRREHSSNRLSTIDTYKCVDFIGDNIDKDSPQITICFYFRMAYRHIRNLYCMRRLRAHLQRRSYSQIQVYSLC